MSESAFYWSKIFLPFSHTSDNVGVMKTDMLQYHLPPELIAQQPGRTRSGSRLLVFRRKSGDILDSRFDRIDDFLSPGDCLVLNDTKVLQARFFGRRSTGGKVEGLFLTENETGTWQVLLKAARKVKPGDLFYLKDKEKKDYCTAVVLDKTADGCRISYRTSSETVDTYLRFEGVAPLALSVNLCGIQHVRSVQNLNLGTWFAGTN